MATCCVCEKETSIVICERCNRERRANFYLMGSKILVTGISPRQFYDGRIDVDFVLHGSIDKVHYHEFLRAFAGRSAIVCMPLPPRDAEPSP